jgi:hypothetical protein
MCLSPQILRWLTYGIAVVVFLLSANTTQASCGDYLHIQGDEQQTTPDSPCGCQGANCDAAPTSPAAPDSVSQAPSTPRDAVCWCVNLMFEHTGLQHGLSDQIPTSAFSLSIFHPPRV